MRFDHLLCKEQIAVTNKVVSIARKKSRDLLFACQITRMNLRRVLVKKIKEFV